MPNWIKNIRRIFWGQGQIVTPFIMALGFLSFTVFGEVNYRDISRTEANNSKNAIGAKKYGENAEKQVPDSIFALEQSPAISGIKGQKSVNYHQCIDWALNRCPDIYIAEKMVEVAGTQIGEVKKGFKPRVQLGISNDNHEYYRLNRDDQEKKYETTIRAEQVIFSGGALERNLQKAYDERDSALVRAILARQDKVKAIINRYLTVLEMKERHKIANELCSYATFALAVSEARYNLNDMEKLEFLEIKTRVSSIIANRNEAFSEFSSAISALQGELGFGAPKLDWETEFMPVSLEYEYFEPENLESLTKLALDQNLSLIQGEMDVEIAKKAYELKKPHSSILFSGEINHNGGSFPLKDKDWQVGIMANMPFSHHKAELSHDLNKVERETITGTLPNEKNEMDKLLITLFDNGTSATERDKAWVDYQGAKAKFGRAAQNTAEKLKQAAEQMKLRRISVESQREAVDFFEEKTLLMELKHQLGELLEVELIKAKIELGEEEMKLKSAIYNHKRAVLDFQGALGEIDG